jgi:glycerophosphoryl diester phosphodiesterase
MTEPEVLAEPVSEPAPQPQAVPPAEPPSGPPSGPGDAPPPARPSSRRMPLVLGAVGVVAAAAVLVAAHPWSSASDTGRQPGGGESPTGQASVSGSPPASTSPPVDGAALPTVLAHRGGLEEHQFETQQAMEAAALAGYAVETDVRYTSDGVAVLVHDERATKGLDCGGADIRVSQTTWDTLRETCHSKPTAADPKQYDVPTYAATMEGIAAASPSAWVFVEVKTDQSAGQVKSFLATIVDNGLRVRAVVTSFQPDYLDKIRKADPDMSRLLFVSKEQVPASQLKDADLWGVAVEKGVATKAYVQQLHDAGIRVVMWLLNDEEQWAKARDLGADLVLTDYPAKYEEWAASG